MALKTRDFATEFKTKDAGSFEGYASIFDNVDDGYDVIEKGAFQEFVKTRDGKVVILNHHNMREPIGKAEVKQDDKGLFVKGDLVMDDPIAARIYTHMKAGTIDAMSIGYDVLPGGAEYTSAGIRRLKALKLWEVTVCTWGMNPLARIEDVKAASKLVTIREYEDFLREEAGFSNAQAKLLASGGWKALQTARDESGEEKAAQQIIDLCNSYSEKK